MDATPHALAPRASKLPTLRGPAYPTLRSLAVLVGVELLVVPAMLMTASPLLAIVLATTLFATWALWMRRKGAAVLQACNRGADLLDRGRLDEAEQLLEQVLARDRAITQLMPVAAFHRARIELQRGNLADAQARLSALLASGWFAPGKLLQSLAPQVQATLALVAALRNELELATQVLGAGKAGPSSLDRWWVLPEAVLELRRGRHGEVLRRIAEQREDLEATLSGRGLRQLQLLEAYALACVVEREDNYRGTHSIGDVDALLHGVRPGSFDFMAVEWPGLREFMQAKRLLGRREP